MNDDRPMDDDLNNFHMIHVEVIEPEAGGAGGATRHARVRHRPRFDRAHLDPPERAELAAGVGAILRAARVGAGLSARALAEEAGCAHSTVLRLEAGTRRPRPAMLTALAVVLDPGSSRLLNELLAAAGSSLREDTPAGDRARRRRARAAGRRRYELWQRSRALDRTANELAAAPWTWLDGRVLDAAERPDAPEWLIDASARMLDRAHAELDQIRALHDAAERIRAHLRRRPRPAS